MTVTTLSADSIADLAEPRADAFKVTVAKGMKLREGRWDAAVRRQEVWVWAEKADGEVDLAKAARGHAVADLNPEGRDANREDLKLPIAGVENDELVGIGNGIRNALARLDQTKGLTSDVEAKARETLRGMLDRLNEQTSRDLASELSIESDAASKLVADAEAHVFEALAEDAEASLDSITDIVRAQHVLVDGAVWRWSRISLGLDEAQTAVIDRAIAIGDRLAERNDATEFKTIAAELHTDGLGDHIDGGFLKLPVLAARSGTQVYSDGRTQWGEFRSDEEVGDAESLASYGLKPFTDDHPSVMVTPANYTQFVRGSCGQDAVLLEDDPNGNRYVKVTILVGDLATLRKIRDGKVELSAGYTTVTVRDSGVDDSGQKFDFRQTKIRINHLALVDRGRAGPLARIQLDGSAWELPATQADAQEHDVKNTDQLDPETAAMLFAAVKAYQHPESPEAAETALGQLAAMTGMEPEAIRTALMVEAAAEPEPDAELELVEMDGLEARMTPDHAAKYRVRQQEQDTMTADTAKINTDMSKDLAEQKAIIGGLQRQVTTLIDDKDQAAMGALYREIVDVCPQLGKAWGDLKKTDKFDLDANAMREAATLDLDPGAAVDLNAARKSKTFDATLGGAYKAAVRGAQARKGGPTIDTETKTGPTHVVNATDSLVANAATFYGSSK